MTEASFLIGIDTGGTYTDAVVIDAERHAIISTAKAITTKGDLSVGVGEALRASIAEVARFKPHQVQMVSVSTTLATNAIVEGHGGAAALALIGFDAKMEERSGLRAAFGSMPIERFSGGHDHAGHAVAKLDEDGLRRWARATAPLVTAFAIAASFATRNPAHELRAAAIVAEETGLPVTLSHQLADALDAPRRAQTAVLNARLVSRVAVLVSAVRQAMADLQLHCPLMLVKGDGSLAGADAVVEKPIETVLSGPAASLIGAQWLSGKDSFILSDMGGTTTDVGLLMDGAPQIANQGAEVGRWRTMVKAIDLKTIGLGGDSEVHVEPGKPLLLGPERAVPISLLAARRPEVIALLEADLAETKGGSQLGKFLILPFGQTAAKPVIGLNAVEAGVLGRVTEQPMPLRSVASGSATQRAVTSLRKRGLIQLCSLTPSDAAHVLNKQANWNFEAAEIAVKIYARFTDMKMPDAVRVKGFAEEIWDAAVQASARVILDVALADVAEGALVDAVVQGSPRKGLVMVTLQPQLPVVAVGGPVKVYYPAVAARLGCEVEFPPHWDVANAVGAACGLVAARITVRIDGDGSGVFLLTGLGAPVQFRQASAALGEAEALAQAAVLELALAQGAKQPKAKLAWTKSFFPNAVDEEGLLSGVLVAEARGAPV